MARFNVDEEYSSMFTPIEFTLDGKEYSVTKIEAGLLESLQVQNNSPKTVVEGFAELVGVKKDTFKKTEFWKIIIAMRYINGCMEKQMGEFQGKNVQGEGVKT